MYILEKISYSVSLGTLIFAFFQTVSIMPTRWVRSSIFIQLKVLNDVVNLISCEWLRNGVGDLRMWKISSVDAG